MGWRELGDMDQTSEFCRACGGGLLPNQQTCPACGEKTAPPGVIPDPSLEAIGVKTAGTRKAGAGTFPIIKDDGKKWILLAMTGVEVPLKKKDGELTPTLKNLDLLGRWLRWCDHATSDQGLQEFWSRAVAAATTSWDRRRLGRWALFKPRHSLLSGLALPEPELNWLRAHAAVQSGKFEEAVRWIELLPDGAFPDVLDLLGMALARGLPVSEARKLEAKMVALNPRHPVSLLLKEAPLSEWRNVSGPEASALEHVRQAALFATGESDQAPGSGPLAVLSYVERSFAQSAPLPADPLSPASRSLDMATLWQYKASRTAYIPESEAGALAEVWAPYADDLLEKWGSLSPLGRDWLTQTIRISEGPTWASVRARLEVLLGDGEAGSPCEEARRAYARSDWSFLREFGAHGEYFLALADLRDGDRTAIERLRGHECLPEGKAAVLDSLEEIAADTRDDISDVVEDETLWGTLVKLGVSSDKLGNTPVRFQEWYHLTQSKEALYSDSFDDAAKLARECLRISTLEDIRDEALNLLAVALFADGNLSAASAALDKAVEDSFSDRLLANWAIVKSQAEPESANATWLAVAERAEHAALRGAAALAVLADAGGDDDLAALIPVAREALFTDGNYDSAMAFLRVVGNNDEDWFKKQDWTASPYYNHAAFRVRVALYHPDQDHLEVLGNLLRKSPDDPELLEIRDSVVDGVMGVMRGDEVDEDSLGVAAWGLRMLDVVPLTPRQESILSLWSVQIALQHFGRDYEDDELPGEGLLKFISRAEALVADAEKGFDDDDRRFVTRQASILRDEFARQNLAWHAMAHDRAVDTYNDFIANVNSVGYGYRIDKQKVRSAAQQFADSCQRHINDIDPVLKMATDEDLAKFGKSLLESWKELQQTALGLKRAI